MAFRSKSPRRAFNEFSYLARTYGVKRIDCVDNILDLRYIDTLFDELSRSELDLEIFYEVKSNLRYDQLAAMKAAGLQRIQTGIESLSNEVLRLMRKGCTALQNIQLLRWCEELDIPTSWNLIAGFPGESFAEYEKMAELVPLLTHLRPPLVFEPVRLDRFSPLHTQSDKFGLCRVRPAMAYFYVYPLGRRELTRLAYYFEFNYQDGRNPPDYLQNLKREVLRWRDLYLGEQGSRPRLDAFNGDDSLTIVDSRNIAPAPRHELRGLAAQVYLECDSAQTVLSLMRRLSGAAAESEIRYVLEKLVAAKLMVEMEGQYLSLAVRRDRPTKNKSLVYDAETQQAETLNQPLHLV